MKEQNDYISTVYSEARTPKTGYPSELAAYLFDRFGMRKGVRLLEVGCGRGDFLEAFQSLGAICYGVDLSDHCTVNKRHLEVACCDVSREGLPYEDGLFDVVYQKSLLEHLYSPDNLMREIRRVLKGGGRAIILTPDWVSQMKVFYEDFTHCRPYDTTSLRDLLQIYGFSGVHAERFYQLPILWKYPTLKVLSRALGVCLSTPAARRLTAVTGAKFFRWSVELMVLGTGVKT
jgi:SAM-dependent methyltransferase